MKSLEDKVNKRACRLINEVYQDFDVWTQKHEEAEELLRPFASDDRSSQLSLSNYGAILSNQGKHAEALKFLDRLIRTNPSFREAYFNRAVALMNTNEKGRRTAPEVFKEAEEHPTAEFAIEAYFDPQGH